jgi:hypothetical protein
MIFCLSFALIFNAIAQVESDNGATSGNVYQIRDVYIDDINRIYNLQLSYNVKYDRELSQKAMRLYWLYYGERYTKLTGKPVTYEVLARIHNGGPNGFKKYATKKYWRAVERRLPNE